MIQSMTGFGRSEGDCCGIAFRVEARSVNHRYCDVYVRLPEGLVRLEQMIKKAISRRFSRGKFEVSISSISQIDPSMKGIRPVIDISTIAQCQSILKELSKVFNVRFNIRNDIGLSDMLALKEIVTSPGIDYDNPEIDKSLVKILDKSLDELMKMRLKEGHIIYRDIKHRINKLRSMIKRIERHFPSIIGDMKRRYTERIKDLYDIPQIDKERLYQEIAIMVDRMDITEEIVRLGSHITQLKDKIEDGVAVGRSLDFLLQEVNREINTIASKASDVKISQIVVDMKAEVERIREQVQNVE